MKPQLVVRKDVKQSWSAAQALPVTDSYERLEQWAEALNSELGWKKYLAQEVAA